MNRIAWLENKIAEASEMLQAEEARLLESPDDFGLRMAAGSIKAHIEQMRHDLYLARAERGHEVIGLRLQAEHLQRGSIPLRLLSTIADHLNRALLALAYRHQFGEEPSRYSDAFVNELDIRLADLRAGSTSLVLTANTAPDILGDSKMEQSLRAAFNLLESDARTLPQAVADAGHRATHHVAKLLTSLEREHCTVELVWTDSAEQDHRWRARPHEVSMAAARMSELVTQAPQTITLDAEIELLSKTGRLALQPLDEGPRINVRYPRQHYGLVQGLHLGQRARFTLNRTSAFNPVTMEEAHSHVLLNVELPEPLGSGKAPKG